MVVSFRADTTVDYWLYNHISVVSQIGLSVDMDVNVLAFGQINQATVTSDAVDVTAPRNATLSLDPSDLGLPGVEPSAAGVDDFDRELPDWVEEEMHVATSGGSTTLFYTSWAVQVLRYNGSTGTWQTAERVNVSRSIPRLGNSVPRVSCAAIGSGWVLVSGDLRNSAGGVTAGFASVFEEVPAVECTDPSECSDLPVLDLGWGGGTALKRVRFWTDVEGTFGHSCGATAMIAAVGAPGDDRVEVYERQDALNPIWVSRQTLRLEDWEDGWGVGEREGAEFGKVVSVRNGLLVVGAPGMGAIAGAGDAENRGFDSSRTANPWARVGRGDTVTGTRNGAVFVYTRPGWNTTFESSWGRQERPEEDIKDDLVGYFGNISQVQLWKDASIQATDSRGIPVAPSYGSSDAVQLVAWATSRADSRMGATLAVSHRDASAVIAAGAEPKNRVHTLWLRFPSQFYGDVPSETMVEAEALDAIASISQGMNPAFSRAVGLGNEMMYVGSPTESNVFSTFSGEIGRLYAKGYCFPGRYLVREASLRMYCNSCALGKWSRGGGRTSSSCTDCSNKNQFPGSAIADWTRRSECSWQCKSGRFGPSCGPCSSFMASRSHLLPPRSRWSDTSATCGWECLRGWQPQVDPESGLVHQCTPPPPPSALRYVVALPPSTLDDNTILLAVAPGTKETQTTSTSGVPIVAVRVWIEDKNGQGESDSNDGPRTAVVDIPWTSPSWLTSVNQLISEYPLPMENYLVGEGRNGTVRSSFWGQPSFAKGNDALNLTTAPPVARGATSAELEHFLTSAGLEASDPVAGDVRVLELRGIWFPRGTIVASAAALTVGGVGPVSSEVTLQLSEPVSNGSEWWSLPSPPTSSTFQTATASDPDLHPTSDSGVFSMRAPITTGGLPLTGVAACLVWIDTMSGAELQWTDERTADGVLCARLWRFNNMSALVDSPTTLYQKLDPEQDTPQSYKSFPMSVATVLSPSSTPPALQPGGFPTLTMRLHGLRSGSAHRFVVATRTRAGWSRWSGTTSLFTLSVPATPPNPPTLPTCRALMAEAASGTVYPNDNDRLWGALAEEDQDDDDDVTAAGGSLPLAVRAPTQTGGRRSNFHVWLRDAGAWHMTDEVQGAVGRTNLSSIEWSSLVEADLDREPWTADDESASTPELGWYRVDTSMRTVRYDASRTIDLPIAPGDVVHTTLGLRADRIYRVRVGASNSAGASNVTSAEILCATGPAAPPEGLAVSDVRHETATRAVVVTVDAPTSYGGSDLERVWVRSTSSDFMAYRSLVSVAAAVAEGGGNLENVDILPDSFARLRLPNADAATLKVRLADVPAATTVCVEAAAESMGGNEATDEDGPSGTCVATPSSAVVPSAPLDVAFELDGIRLATDGVVTSSAGAVAVLVTRPESLGGAPLTSYRVEVSRDGLSFAPVMDVSPHQWTASHPATECLGWSKLDSMPELSDAASQLDAARRTLNGTLSVSACPVLRVWLPFLKADTSYRVRVRASNSVGNGPFTASVSSIRTAPTTTSPSGPRVTQTTDIGGAVLVDMLRPIDDGGSPLDAFEIEWEDVDDVASNGLAIVPARDWNGAAVEDVTDAARTPSTLSQRYPKPPVPLMQLQVPLLLTGSTYRFRTRACPWSWPVPDLDGCGAWSDWSFPLTLSVSASPSSLPFAPERPRVRPPGLWAWGTVLTWIPPNATGGHALNSFSIRDGVSNSELGWSTLVPSSSSSMCDASSTSPGVAPLPSGLMADPLDGEWPPRITSTSSATLPALRLSTAPRVGVVGARGTSLSLSVRATAPTSKIDPSPIYSPYSSSLALTLPAGSASSPSPPSAPGRPLIALNPDGDSLDWVNAFEAAEANASALFTLPPEADTMQIAASLPLHLGGATPAELASAKVTVFVRRNVDDATLDAEADWPENCDAEEGALACRTRLQALQSETSEATQWLVPGSAGANVALETTQWSVVEWSSLLSSGSAFAPKSAPSSSILASSRLVAVPACASLSATRPSRSALLLTVSTAEILAALTPADRPPKGDGAGVDIRLAVAIDIGAVAGAVSAWSNPVRVTDAVALSPAPPAPADCAAASGDGQLIAADPVLKRLTDSTAVICVPLCAGSASTVASAAQMDIEVLVFDSADGQCLDGPSNILGAMQTVRYDSSSSGSTMSATAQSDAPGCYTVGGLHRSTCLEVRAQTRHIDGDPNPWSTWTSTSQFRLSELRPSTASVAPLPPLPPVLAPRYSSGQTGGNDDGVTSSDVTALAAVLEADGRPRRPPVRGSLDSVLRTARLVLPCSLAVLESPVAGVQPRALSFDGSQVQDAGVWDAVRTPLPALSVAHMARCFGSSVTTAAAVNASFSAQALAADSTAIFGAVHEHQSSGLLSASSKKSALATIPSASPPSVPGPVQIVEMDSSTTTSSSPTLELRWQLPSQTNGAPITHFLIERNRTSISVYPEHLDPPRGTDRIAALDVVRVNVNLAAQALVRRGASSGVYSTDPSVAEAIAAAVQPSSESVMSPWQVWEAAVPPLHLFHGSRYRVRVAAESEAGIGPWSEWSDEITQLRLTTPPSPPAPLLVSAGPSWVELSLDHPADSGGAPITSMLVDVLPVSNSDDTDDNDDLASIDGSSFGLRSIRTVQVSVQGPPPTAARIEGLNASSSYAFVSRAVTVAGAGNVSKASGVAGTHPAVAPGAVEIVDVHHTSSGLRLHVKPPSDWGGQTLLCLQVRTRVDFALHNLCEGDAQFVTGAARALASDNEDGFAVGTHIARWVQQLPPSTINDSLQVARSGLVADYSDGSALPTPYTTVSDANSSKPLNVDAAWSYVASALGWNVTANIFGGSLAGLSDFQWKSEQCIRPNGHVWGDGWNLSASAPPLTVDIPVHNRVALRIAVAAVTARLDFDAAIPPGLIGGSSEWQNTPSSTILPDEAPIGRTANNIRWSNNVAVALATTPATVPGAPGSPGALYKTPTLIEVGWSAPPNDGGCRLRQLFLRRVIVDGPESNVADMSTFKLLAQRNDTAQGEEDLYRFVASSAIPFPLLDVDSKGLRRATWVRYWSTARSRLGEGESSREAISATPPELADSPVNVSDWRPGSSPVTVGVRWAPPLDDGGRDVTAYVGSVRAASSVVAQTAQSELNTQRQSQGLAPLAPSRNSGPGGEAFVESPLGSASARYGNMSDLQPSTWYEARVAAVTSFGTGQASTPILVRTDDPIPCPSNCTSSLQGICHSWNGKCLCYPGFQGADCSVLAGAAWQIRVEGDVETPEGKAILERSLADALDLSARVASRIAVAEVRMINHPSQLALSRRRLRAEKLSFGGGVSSEKQSFGSFSSKKLSFGGGATPEKQSFGGSSSKIQSFGGSSSKIQSFGGSSSNPYSSLAVGRADDMGAVEVVRRRRTAGPDWSGIREWDVTVIALNWDAFEERFGAISDATVSEKRSASALRDECLRLASSNSPLLAGAGVLAAATVSSPLSDAPRVQVPSCSVHTTCGECTTSNACGWCAQTSTCSVGTRSGPAALSPVCPAPPSSRQGEAQGYRHALGEACATDCRMVFDCDECSSRADCAWCEGDSRCHRAADLAPPAGAIEQKLAPAWSQIAGLASNSRFAGPWWCGAVVVQGGACPIDRCANRVSLVACTEDPHCGWCQRTDGTGSCSSGTALGPSTDTCDGLDLWYFTSRSTCSSLSCDACMRVTGCGWCASGDRGRGSCGMTNVSTGLPLLGECGLWVPPRTLPESSTWPIYGLPLPRSSDPEFTAGPDRVISRLAPSAGVVARNVNTTCPVSKLTPTYICSEQDSCTSCLEERGCAWCSNPAGEPFCVHGSLSSTCPTSSSGVKRSRRNELEGSYDDDYFALLYDFDPARVRSHPFLDGDSCPAECGLEVLTAKSGTVTLGTAHLANPSVPSAYRRGNPSCEWIISPVGDSSGSSQGSSDAGSSAPRTASSSAAYDEVHVRIDAIDLGEGDALLVMDGVVHDKAVAVYVNASSRDPALLYKRDPNTGHYTSDALLDSTLLRRADATLVSILLNSPVTYGQGSAKTHTGYARLVLLSARGGGQGFRAHWSAKDAESLSLVAVLMASLAAFVVCVFAGIFAARICSRDRNDEPFEFIIPDDDESGRRTEGVPHDIIARFPAYEFDPATVRETPMGRATKKKDPSADEESEWRCIVCQGDFEKGEKVRSLLCNHHFHIECVDRWLKQRGSCPLCREDVCEMAVRHASIIEAGERDPLRLGPRVKRVRIDNPLTRSSNPDDNNSAEGTVEEQTNPLLSTGASSTTSAATATTAAAAAARPPPPPPPRRRERNRSYSSGSAGSDDVRPQSLLPHHSLLSGLHQPARTPQTGRRVVPIAAPPVEPVRRASISSRESTFSIENPLLANRRRNNS